MPKFLSIQLLQIVFILMYPFNGNAQDLIYSDSLPFNPDTLELTELCSRFKTDKCKDQHGYIIHYSTLFEPIRDSVSRLLEIGILHGASHYLWQAYFPNADIYGIDIDSNTLINEGRIHTSIADQSDRKALTEFTEENPGTFDIILDDGGHSMDQQQISFAYFFPYIEPGGYYIIEDVHTSLSEYYPPQFYGVNSDTSNTTLEMIERYIRTSKIESEYLTDNEINFLEENIDYMQLIFQNNEKHSVMCIVHKKE